MKDYIILFKNHSEYEAYINGDDKILPNVSLCGEEDEMHYEPKPHDYSQDYLTFVAKESGTFTFIPQESNVISYSTDNGGTWTQGNSVTVNKGDKVMWKGTMTPASSQGIGKFSSTGNFDVQGNAMSLLFGDNYKEQTSIKRKNYVLYRLFYNNANVINAKNLSLPATTLTQHCYQTMFYQCTSLVTAPELPATTLADYCYNSMFGECTSLVTAPKLPVMRLADSCYSFMFSGCTSLVTAPELPATTLTSECYSNMFEFCKSLTTAPELPAETLTSYCYNSMFEGCKSLTTAPELPATTLAERCYSYMFRNCTSLVTAPELPAETLADGCYRNMFRGCTGLTEAPELPATTLTDYCYQYMFSGCTSLVTAPELPAATLVNYCYQYMFEGCTSLNYIKAVFTTTPSSTYTSYWVRDVASTGTFVKNSAAQWDVSGANGIPTGWTVQTASA